MSIAERMFKFLGRKESAVQLVEDTTQGYRANTRILDQAWVEDLPRFRLTHAQMMMRDPAVRFALKIRNSVLPQSEIEVECDSPEVERWLKDTWATLWGKHGVSLRKTKRWGFGAFQVLYDVQDGLLQATKLKEFSPFDVRPLRGDGEIVGYRLKSRGGTAIGTHGFGNKRLFAPRALWTTFDADFQNPYGNSICSHAFGPWLEKWMDGGSKKTTQLRMMKDSSRGDVLWYPPDKKVKLPDGTEISWRDVIREVGENIRAGGSIVLPNLFGRDSQKLVDYQPPQDTGNPTGILEWGKRLDSDIFWALGVPPEVVEAASTGSGFSGRSIPLMVFLGILDEEFSPIVSAVDEFVLRPIGQLNFGADKCNWTIRAKPLMDTFIESMSDSAAGGGALGGSAGDASRDARTVSGEAATQFDEEFERKHSRTDSGEFGMGRGRGSAEETEPVQEAAAKPVRELSATIGSGKKLQLADGGQLPEHLQALRIPPAWTDVQVNLNPEGNLLATGRDAKGRKQSVYSSAHAARQAGLKFSRIGELTTKIDEIRSELSSSTMTEEAAALRLIAATGMRPGSTRDTKAEKQAFGAVTLLGRHVLIDGDAVSLRFTGKKGVERNVPIRNPELAATLRERKQRSGDDGRLFNTTGNNVRKFSKILDGGGFKPKDFRTLKGTSVAADLVRSGEPPATEKEYKSRVRGVAKQVAAVLGNTPTVALQSYIDPTVFSAWRV